MSEPIYDKTVADALLKTAGNEIREALQNARPKPAVTHDDDLDEEDADALRSVLREYRSEIKAGDDLPYENVAYVEVFDMKSGEVHKVVPFGTHVKAIRKLARAEKLATDLM